MIRSRIKHSFNRGKQFMKRRSLPHKPIQLKRSYQEKDFLYVRNQLKTELTDRGLQSHGRSNSLHHADRIGIMRSREGTFFSWLNPKEVDGGISELLLPSKHPLSAWVTANLAEHPDHKKVTHKRRERDFRQLRRKKARANRTSIGFNLRALRAEVVTTFEYDGLTESSVAREARETSWLDWHNALHSADTSAA